MKVKETIMSSIENDFKNKNEIYEFELFFLNNIYDCIEEINTDLDCLIESYDEFEKEAFNDFRTVIINLATTFQLIVKFCLENEHWSLIFADINKAEESKLENGDFISVDIANGILRLKNICGMNYNFKNLKKVCNFRNCLVHYTLKSVNIIEVINTISKGIREFKKFFENEIIEILPKEAKKDFNDALNQLKINCDNLDLLIVKIIKKGNAINERQ